MNKIEDLVAIYDTTHPHLYFLISIVNPNPKGPLDSDVITSMQRVILTAAKSYTSIDELLGDTNIIPLNDKNYNVAALKTHILRDARRGVANEYDDFVAYSGKQLQDRPIAKVGEIYYAHPRIQDLVKRK